MDAVPSSFSITGYQLKYIALATMTIDHIGAVLLAYGALPYNLARAFGRMAFPIFCFLLVEGFFHTSSHRAYLGRLALFALISEIPFDMALFHFPSELRLEVLFGHQNIFFTLALGFLSMCVVERIRVEASFLAVFIFAAGACIGQVLHFDYGAYGIAVIFLFYACRVYYPRMPRLWAYLLALLPLYLAGDWKRFFLLLDLPLFLLYRGERGRALPGQGKLPGGKYFFYWYYPGHLLGLALISLTQRKLSLL